MDSRAFHCFGFSHWVAIFCTVVAAMLRFIPSGLASDVSLDLRIPQ